MKRITLAIIIILAVQLLAAADGALPRAIRGVWLTNVDSKALNSKKNIDAAVDHCAKVGINTIFVVTWNKAMTTYPSPIAKSLTGIEIDTLFRGRDPLKELIESAHRRNIKVIAWFEFGFSTSFKQQGGRIIEVRPDWAALNNERHLVVKNGFDWMNGFNPEVQDFMLKLIMEVVKNYDVDGIQGDDRLPAMPSESGYDAYTVGLYKQQHNGAEPPHDFKDPAWIQWRADLLNRYMERIHAAVKAEKPAMIIAMSPSVYPWSKEEYLQDWPTWVNKGYVDQVIPQIYRYSLDRYIETIDEMLTTQIDKDKLDRVTPGIL
ncbi:MAG: glycoside hydrolase family 10 protein, partial [Bacteroidota bacterium]